MMHSGVVIEFIVFDLARIGLILGVILFLLRKGLKIGYVMLISSVALIIFYGMDVSGMTLVLRRAATGRISLTLLLSLSPEVIVMIAGIMLFKETLEVSGAVRNLSDLFIQHGVPVVPVFCLLPFTAGMLTGHTVGFVGGTFPLLVTVAGKASPPLINLAFVSGFIGVLLSPVHLCLILTREYFAADLSGIYRKTVPACILIFVIAWMQYIWAK